MVVLINVFFRRKIPGIGQFRWSQIVFSVIELSRQGVAPVSGSLARISLSLRLGHRRWAKIGLSLNRLDPFSLVWAISHLFRIDPIIGGFIGLKVSIRGTFPD